MKDVIEFLEKIKSGEVNIQNLAKETGISASKIYKWKERESDISLSDAMKLHNWLNKSDNSLIAKEPPSEYGVVPRTVSQQLEAFRAQMALSLEQVLNQQKLTRADVRAFGEYQVMKDAQGDEVVRQDIMGQINRLVALNLGAIAKMDTAGSTLGNG